MKEQLEFPSAAEWYAAILHNTRHEQLPPGYPTPQPPEFWPEENVALLERYLAWLYADNAAYTSIHDFYLPAAGHVLGYHLQHHSKLDLMSGLRRVMDYFQVRGLGERWLEMGKHALHRFRRFMHEERGYARLPETLQETHRIRRYQEPLPNWLVEQLRQMQQIRQQNWRQSRLVEAIVNFWAAHTRVWLWLLARYEIQEIQDIQRSYLFAYIDDRLAAGHSARTVNLAVRAFQATLRFLQERDYEIPQTLLRQMNLKAPDSLPRFLTDEQVGRLQAELERCVQIADNPAAKRNTLLDRALFYLLWQSGLRVCEAEDMHLQDLDLSQRQLAVRNSKGKKDRMVYLTERTCTVVQEYLAVRGTGTTDLVFLYRHEPLAKDFLRNRIKAAGKRAGVKVTPHQLRHTFATQLVNASCRITTIQALMGHKRLNTTLIYTRIHNHTVADDYYTAMAKVEKKLQVKIQKRVAVHPRANGSGATADISADYLLNLALALKTKFMPEDQRELVMELRQGLKSLVEKANGDPLEQVVNVQMMLPQPMMLEMTP